MKISFVKDKFIVYSEYEERDILLKKGFVWDSVLRRWVTTDARIAESLIQHCDQSAIYQIGWTKKGEVAKIHDSVKTESSLSLLHPPHLTPFPFQVAGVEYILKRKACLLGDEMGLGKTAQSLLTINMRSDVRSVLVVCPSILKYNWLREARQWLIGEMLVYIYESKKIRYYKGRNTSHNKQTILHVINYDILEKFSKRLAEARFEYAIFDESHYIKNPTAKRTKISVALAHIAKYKLFVTGTPIYNKPKDLFVILNSIDPVMFGDFLNFGNRYCNPKKIKVRGRFIYTYDGSSNLDELNKILRANYMVRRMKKDVLKDLPDKIKDVISLNEDALNGLVEKEKKLASSYKANRDKLQAEITRIKAAGGDLDSEYKSRIRQLHEDRMRSIGEISKIRHELALKKVPYVVEFVTELLDSSEDGKSKLLLFAHHKDVIAALQAALKKHNPKYNPVAITGETSDVDRQRNIHIFQNTDQSRVFIGSMTATGVGITLTSANTVVFAELDWTPAVVMQAEDRAHRIGQKDTVWVYHVVADGSLDSKMAKMLVEKDEVARKILDWNDHKMFEKLIE